VLRYFSSTSLQKERATNNRYSGSSEQESEDELSKALFSSVELEQVVKNIIDQATPKELDCHN
jgi:hypothetical protein